MNDCDCGWCGKCREQLDEDIVLDRPGWHTPAPTDDDDKQRGFYIGVKVKNELTFELSKPVDR